MTLHAKIKPIYNGPLCFQAVLSFKNINIKLELAKNKYFLSKFWIFKYRFNVKYLAKSGYPNIAHQLYWGSTVHHILYEFMWFSRYLNLINSQMFKGWITLTFPATIIASYCQIRINNYESVSWSSLKVIEVHNLFFI